MEDVFRSVADPTRRLILAELAERDEQTLYELCVRLVMKHGVDVSRQAIAKHIGILEAARLVRSQARGKYKVLRLDRSALQREMAPWLRGLLHGSKKRR